MDIWLEVPTPVEAVLPRRLLLRFDRPLIVGRHSDGDIRVIDRCINRHHCEVGRDECGAWIRDRTSHHGTHVNGERLERGPVHRLRPDDVVVVPHLKMRVGWDFEVKPYWLCWEAGVIVSLAQRVRDEGDSAAMPILGDALEEAGCTDAAILEHLRGLGPHVRECWIIDALLKSGQEPRTK